MRPPFLVASVCVLFFSADSARGARSSSQKVLAYDAGAHFQCPWLSLISVSLRGGGAIRDAKTGGPVIIFQGVYFLLAAADAACDDAILSRCARSSLEDEPALPSGCTAGLGAIIAAPKVLVDEETYDATAARAAEFETSLTARQAEVARLKEILKAQHREIPDAYLCPITMDPMEDPVMAAEGHSYEKSEISAWFALGNNPSPKTGAALRHQFLTPNHALRNAIQVFLEEEVRKFELQASS